MIRGDRDADSPQVTDREERRDQASEDMSEDRWEMSCCLRLMMTDHQVLAPVIVWSSLHTSSLPNSRAWVSFKSQVNQRPTALCSSVYFLFIYFSVFECLAKYYNIIDKLLCRSFINIVTVKKSEFPHKYYWAKLWHRSVSGTEIVYPDPVLVNICCISSPALN